MFTDSAWKQHKVGTSPNRVYLNEGKRAAAVVVERGQRGDDYPLSKVALDRVLEAEKKGDKIDKAYVVLRERSGGAFRAAETARAVSENVRKLRLLNGKRCLGGTF